MIRRLEETMPVLSRKRCPQSHPLSCIPRDPSALPRAEAPEMEDGSTTRPGRAQRAVGMSLTMQRVLARRMNRAFRKNLCLQLGARQPDVERSTA